MSERLITKVKSYVIELLDKKLLSSNYYHNIAHTKQVVSKVKELALLEACNTLETSGLVIAAWFHDTGYVYKDEGHEEESVNIAQAFLKQEQAADDVIQQVTELILATKVAAIPCNLLECIIKDADYWHLASEEFMAISSNLLKEINAKQKLQISESHWMKLNTTFLDNHVFYTSTAKALWQPKKEANMLQIKTAIK